MAVTKAFTLYAAGINAGLIDQISSFGLDPKLERFVLTGDGDVDPRFVAVKGAAPEISFTTSAIAKALALSGISGLAISSSANFFFQKLAANGTRAGTLSHLKMAATKGLIIPVSLRAGTGQIAEITYRAILISDAGAAPIAFTASQTLTGSPATNEAFVVGPVSINGTVINGVQSISIEFGINVSPFGGDGDVYPSFAAIMDRKPTVTIEGPDMDYLATLGIPGIAQSATDTTIYLRKVATDGTRVADGTAEHIKISIDDGHIGFKSADARSGDPASLGIEIVPVYDGTNAILVISTASAIT